MGFQESVEKSLEEISRLFESAPSLSKTVMINANTGEISVGEWESTVPPAEAAKRAAKHSRRPGVTITGLEEGALPGNWAEALNKFMVDCSLEAMRRQMTPETLLEPVYALGIYLKALQDGGVVKDYIVQFDESTSSHLSGAIGYICRIQPADGREYSDSWWRRCWEAFLAFLREPRVASRLAELIREAGPQAVTGAKDAVELVKELLKLLTDQGLLSEPPLARPV